MCSAHYTFLSWDLRYTCFVIAVLEEKLACVHARFVKEELDMDRWNEMDNCDMYGNHT